MAKVFVSSPLGFSMPGRNFLIRTLYPTLRGNGYAILDQWESRQDEPPIGDVGARNVTLLLQADVVLAVLDGPDVDSGTAAEIGFASAAGVPVVGLRTDSTRQRAGSAATAGNLQVDFFIRRSGGEVVLSLDAAISAMESALTRGP